MKKLIAVSAVAALAATALSAEITFGSWGRALWVTAANAYDATEDKDVTVTDVHQSWGEHAPRTALCVSGTSDNVGFNLDIRANGTEADLPGDNANIWVKPVEQVKIVVGKIDQNVLRGDAAYGLWNWDRLGIAGGLNFGKLGDYEVKFESEGWTFADYLDAQGAGVSIIATPVEGLTIGAGIPLKLNNANGGWDNGAKMTSYAGRTLEDVYAHGTAYVGAYAIEGVGTIKAALKTLPKVGDDSNNEIAAAFDLTSVENLFLSIGARLWTLDDTPKVVTAYAKYGVNEQLTAHAILGTSLSTTYLDKDDGLKDDGIGFTAGVGVDYSLDGGLALFADVRYVNGVMWKGTNADNSDNLVIGAGATKGFSNGLIGIAFEGSTNSNGRYLQKANDKGVQDKFAWEIPVKFEYWF